jgi:hypothetical protein
MGLARSGRRAKTSRVAQAVLEAAARFFDYRLPDAFAGYDPGRHPVPDRAPERLLAPGLGGRRRALLTRRLPS